jgi:hypothetical protein
MNIITKIKSARIALLSAVVAGLVFQAVPASANNNPTYNLSGNWKNSVGESIQIFQQKERVVIVAVNAGWAQILEGYYYTPTKAHLVNSRVTRSNGCQTTMSIDITVNSNNKYQVTATALEGTCGLTLGQQYSDNNVQRVLP